MRWVPNIGRLSTDHEAGEANCSSSLSVKGDEQLLVHSRNAYTSGSRPPRRCAWTCSVDYTASCGVYAPDISASHRLKDKTMDASSTSSTHTHGTRIHSSPYVAGMVPFRGRRKTPRSRGSKANTNRLVLSTRDPAIVRR
ncbi:hypothetical protein K523DRAFT_400099 [Schizophyllum commune Tattone D]|nr:hypothetical protein K523DRAFT_400099 [Schizophyllum commune Tattone D]